MKKIDIAKRVTSIVVGLGTSAVVSSILKSNVPPASNLPMKVAVYATSIVIGSMAGRATVKHSEEMIDEICGQWKEITKTETE